MPGAERWTQTFLAAAREETRSALASSPDLPEVLDALMTAARAAWPDLEVGDDRLLRHVAERLPAEGALDFLREARAGDLLLACACEDGDPAALAAFETACLLPVEGALPHSGDRASFVDEVKQVVREKLFVSAPGERPRIAEYGGRSDLRTWLRVVATRVALDLLRRHHPQEAADDDLTAELASATDDPELTHLAQRYRTEFRAALEESARALSVHHRNLLRQHYVDGLTLDELAALHRVHRVTLARRVAAAREAFATGARRILLGRFGLGKRELDSIMTLVQSRIDLSLRRLLGTGA
jgi:RNA polymerase sigma-70 factor, ECF subfamily